MMDFGVIQDNSKPILSGSSVPRIVPSALHELAHVLVIKTLGRQELLPSIYISDDLKNYLKLYHS